MMHKRLVPARIEELPSFTLAGVSAITTNEAEFSGAGKIVGLFEQFHSQHIAEHLSHSVHQPTNTAVISTMSKAMQDPMK
ncbi:hypothetical protein [Paenibacillus qinlingensis]|uniref:hypothetical protein n=1 Tax=Paenibacillus qinlingensis TaxID=1837343 RepID=UPI0015653190|nr:hypothetical protein [Paenibacillus qinlingensis]NQX63174.1 hypothetical protein [Paenibacillus qinlingensis]